MTPLDEDLFDTPDDDLERDQYQRPIIKPPPGGWPDKVDPATPRPYTRASTFASALDDGPGLAIWSKRHIALSVSRRPDLQAVIAGLSYGDKKLDGYIEEALERAKDQEESLAAANWGTAVHRFTEPDSPPHMPERIKVDVDAYKAELDRLEFETLETELFVVHDSLQVAGTFDHLVRSVPLGCPPRVADKKTGKLHPLSMAIQLAVYAGGQRYDPKTGERSPIHPDLDRSKGILAHIPLGSGTCRLYEVDLYEGWVAARLAYAVRAQRSNEKHLFTRIG